MGQVTPLVLVHQPNAGGSSWEWRKIFPALANHFTVHAIDLLGFGLSDKPDVPYSGRMYADLLHDFLQDVIAEPADVLGSVLGASYAVNAAVRRPESLRRLILVNPTGCMANLPSRLEQLTWSTLRTPLFGTSIYYALVSKQQIERELREHAYFNPALVTPELVDELYAASHQPGSRYAAAAFIAGRLDLPMRLAFSSLTQPTLLVWGHEAYYTPVAEAADLLYRHPEARLVFLDECGMFPHDEKAGEFLALVRNFMSGFATGEAAA